MHTGQNLRCREAEVAAGCRRRRSEFIIAIIEVIARVNGPDSGLGG
jgi:hypothetical protein